MFSYAGQLPYGAPIFDETKTFLVGYVGRRITREHFVVCSEHSTSLCVLIRNGDATNQSSELVASITELRSSDFKKPFATQMLTTRELRRKEKENNKTIADAIKLHAGKSFAINIIQNASGIYVTVMDAMREIQIVSWKLPSGHEPRYVAWKTVTNGRDITAVASATTDVNIPSVDTKANVVLNYDINNQNRKKK